MKHPEEWLAWLGLFVVMSGPAMCLVVLRRWFCRWWAALLVTVLITPPVAFFAVGWVSWRLAYERVIVQRDTSIPDSIGRTGTEYLGFIFAACGAYGIGLAFLGLGLSVPLLVAWRLSHPRSFGNVTRSSPLMRPQLHGNTAL